MSLEALARIRVLYDIEDRAKGMTCDDRLSLRRQEAVPVMSFFGTWLGSLRSEVLPMSPLGQAVTHALNRYAEDGDLTIDNNAAERALRGVAVGRKNWPFWGSDTGGKTAAVLTSFHGELPATRDRPVEVPSRRVDSAAALPLASHRGVPPRCLGLSPPLVVIHRSLDPDAAHISYSPVQ